MSKIRVHELAKELNISSKEIIELLKEFDYNIKNHMSTVDDEAKKIVIEYFSEDDKKTEEIKDELKITEVFDEDLEVLIPTNILNIENSNFIEKSNQKKKKKKVKADEIKTIDKINNDNITTNINSSISVKDNITIKDLANKINVQSSELIKKLIGLGIMATINQEISFDLVQKIAQIYNINVSKEEEKSLEDTLLNDFIDNESDLEMRAPVVTIMGHVDHGKTSLLDAIRKTHVTLQEAGGITQHIGAYTVEINNNTITFLDTPGHEAFTSMRARGAQATDIAVLVVAADDGVMPQTVEAINHAKAAKVPMIIAINKIDKPGANPDKVKQELTEYGLIAEDWGGDLICVPVSAKTKEGLENLLEMILLVAEMQELKANPNRLAKGIVVESKLDKGRGPVATILVKNGTLKNGDFIIAGLTHGKVRAMFDDKGKSVKSAGPSIPVEVLGFNEVPDAGDLLYVLKDEKTSKQIVEKRIELKRGKMINETHKVSLENLFSQIEQGEVKELNIVIKADVQGSVEALIGSLEKLSNDKVKLKVIHGGVGAITETDITLASASNAIIIGFNVRPDTKARALAEKEKVDYKTYRIIYEAINDIEAAMKGLLDPEYKEVIQGRVEVRNIFKLSSVGTIAGCYVVDGKINRNNNVRIIRDGIVIFEGKLGSLKRFKDDVKEVTQGFECGLSIEKYNDIREGDIIEASEMQQIKE